jgi:hypothetical protein
MLVEARRLSAYFRACFNGIFLKDSVTGVDKLTTGEGVPRF